MRSTQRIGVIGAAGLLVLGLAACSAPAPEPTSSQSQTAAREKVAIRFAAYGNSIDDPTGMANDPIKKAIESATNLTINYDTGTEGFDDRMVTELATGSGPDLFSTWGESEKIQSWIADGAVIDMEALVAADPARYPILNKMFTSAGYKAYNKLYSGDENKAYAIYAIGALPTPAFGGVPVYNQALLDKYNGGKVPSTVDEFIAFTTKAGKDGVAGWWPRNDKLTTWGEIDKTIAQPQGTSISAPTDQAWTGFARTGDDTWKLMTTSDKSKAVVKQLAQMYSDNALSKGVGTKGDFDDAYASFGLSELASANFGFGYAPQFRDFWKSAWQQAHPDTAKVSDLTEGVALQGAGGTYSQQYQTSGWMAAHWFIPSSAKNPDRVLDLIEFMASTKGQDLVFKGIEGQTYTAGADGKPTYIKGAWDGINKAYGTSDGRGKYVWFEYLFSGTSFMTELETKDWAETVNSPVDYSALWSSDQDNELLNAAQSTIDTYVDKVVVKLPDYYNLIVLGEDAQKMRTAMKEVSNRYLAGMIGGQMDVEENWPKYVKDFEAAGASKYEALFNQAVQTAKALANQ
jgi:hypothetical protein